MVKRFSKAHRAKLSAAATARYAKKGKKRGVKPGTKRGKYKVIKWQAAKHRELLAEIKADNSKIIATYNPVPLTPYEQLDKIINDLENRILNTVTRIKNLGI